MLSLLQGHLLFAAKIARSPDRLPEINVFGMVHVQSHSQIQRLDIIDRALRSRARRSGHFFLFSHYDTKSKCKRRPETNTERDKKHATRVHLVTLPMILPSCLLAGPHAIACDLPSFIPTWRIRRIRCSPSIVPVRFHRIVSAGDAC